MKKKLKIHYQKKVNKFFNKNKNLLTKDDVDLLIIKAIKKIYLKEKTNIDLKKIATLANYYRIRKGDIRVVFYIYENDQVIITVVENIDFRGSIYS